MSCFTFTRFRPVSGSGTNFEDMVTVSGRAECDQSRIYKKNIQSLIDALSLRMWEDVGGHGRMLEDTTGGCGKMQEGGCGKMQEGG
jgi:hypothetical protein